MNNKDNLLEAVRLLKINFTNAVAAQDGMTLFTKKFDITPRDFLNFAKKDLLGNDPRAHINALTNAKRAIDCQTDTIFVKLGIPLENFPPAIKAFINTFKNQVNHDAREHLKLLECLGIAPTKVISKTRTLRNKLEHFYQTPDASDVQDAIDLADLFINATENKTNFIGDVVYINNPPEGEYVEIANSLGLVFNANESTFAIKVNLQTIENRTNFTIKNDEQLFYHLLKIILSFQDEITLNQSFIELLEFIGHPIPSKNINVKNAYM